MLLSKLYMSIGEFGKAKEQLDILIDKSGYSLMKESFGTFFEGGESVSWPITRNVIWDLHRPENKLIAANKDAFREVWQEPAGKPVDELELDEDDFDDDFDDYFSEDDQV